MSKITLLENSAPENTQPISLWRQVGRSAMQCISIMLILIICLSFVCYYQAFGVYLSARKAAVEGAIEATLPKASLDSVNATVLRNLDQNSFIPGLMPIEVKVNHQPASRIIKTNPGDIVTVSISFHTQTILENICGSSWLIHPQSKIETSHSIEMPCW